VRARIIILNWNGCTFLHACLASIEAERTTEVEVVLVDNGSTDGSEAFVRERYPWVRVLSLGTNRGFAGGNNAGAAGYAGDYLIFLNNDTVVQRGWLTALVSAAERSNAAIATSRLVRSNDPAILDSAGDGYLRCGGAYKIGQGQPAASASLSREVFGACGAAFLIRTDLFHQLGGFDESFFVVYEDVDLSYRARLTGARVIYAADAVVHHAVSAALGRVSVTAVFHGQRNLEWTWIKNTPRSLLWRSLPSHVAYDAAAFLVYARQGHLLTWMRAKVAALAGLPRVFRERRAVQAQIAVDPAALWQLMDADWVRIKRQEKQAQFGQGSQEPSARSKRLDT